MATGGGCIAGFGRPTSPVLIVLHRHHAPALGISPELALAGPIAPRATPFTLTSHRGLTALLRAILATPPEWLKPDSCPADECVSGNFAEESSMPRVQNAPAPTPGKRNRRTPTPPPAPPEAFTVSTITGSVRVPEFEPAGGRAAATTGGVAIRRTIVQKREAARGALADPATAKMSDRGIAAKLDVSRPFVSKMRKQVRTPTIAT